VGAEPAGVLVVVVSTVDIDPSTGRSGLAVTPTDGVATGVGKIGGGDTTRLGVGGSGITIKTAPMEAKRCRPVVDAAGVAISKSLPRLEAVALLCQKACHDFNGRGPRP
jgi:hypothetical protein